MSTPTYRPGERLQIILDVEVIAPPDESGTYLLKAGALELDLPLGDPAFNAEIHRAMPADGIPKPCEIWADAHGAELWAVYVAEDEVHLIDYLGYNRHWRHVHADPETGPIRLVRPAPGKPGPACTTPAPMTAGQS
ncbi:hypothetical protein [Nonomuraea typhae]|uniref:hypothetical protein n=1 Tax=Nonomuraea typhae TaxID=2603600 RepID=UPI0012FA6EF9|nr:hypothetical protein [Nonomuraea typhae]